jgi:putative DNA primase/helicase
VSSKANFYVPARTDLGNAELFTDLYRDQVRFDHGRQQWLLWNTHWWAQDIDGELMRRAKNVVRNRRKMSMAISDAKMRSEEVSWSQHSESLPKLKAMLVLAQSHKPIADAGKDWDANPFLLGVANGVVNLKTGSLVKGSPEQRITLHSEVPYSRDAKAPRFERFLKEVFGDDTDLVSYTQRAIGYSLTGATTEQCFFALFGDGANGKSTFLSAIRNVFGGYSCNLPFSAFELEARASIPNDVATLPGRRFVTAIETAETSQLNAARIKALTGSDPITARLLHREFFTFLSVSKFWLAFNHRPIVTDDSHGFWRRVHLIPFLRQFNPNGEPNLDETLRAEAPGILAWAVRGSIAWQANGLNPPASVREATETYRDESDAVKDFLSAKCVLDGDARVAAIDLWEAYRYWVSLETVESPTGRTEFSHRLEALGLKQVRAGHDKTRIWLGIRLKTESEIAHPDLDAAVRPAAAAKLQ